MEAGANVTYNWSATGDLYFDLHSHGGGQVDYHVRNASTNGTAGNFSAPASQTYSLLWENRGPDPVTLDWELTGAFGPRDDGGGPGGPDGVPGPGLFLTLAALLGAACLRRHSSW